MTAREMKEKFDKSFIREVALERETHIVDLILKILNQISEKYRENIMLLRCARTPYL